MPIHWFLRTTDKGANEMFSRKMMTVAVRDCKDILFVEQDCLEHCSHLITLGGLKQIDSLLRELPGITYKYFSSCAIVTNVMRDCAKNIYLEWCVAYGAASANKRVLKLMPKCNSGRWGSIHVTEERLLAMGASELAHVLATVLERKTAKSKHKKTPVDSSSLSPDQLAIEQAAEYSKKMGTWRSYALTAVRDIFWHKLLAIMHRSREPVMHFTHFARANPTEEELLKHGSPLCQLVNGKMDDIYQEFDALLENSACTVVATL